MAIESRDSLDIVEEALGNYLDDQKWEQLVTAGEMRAKARGGVTEADVPRLIEEVRNENGTRSALCSDVQQCPRS